MPRDQRQKLVKHIFSPSGIVATSNNYVELEDKFLSLIDSIDNAQIKVLLERLSPLMIENAKALDRPGLCLDNTLWTNNNCESINHVHGFLWNLWTWYLSCTWWWNHSTEKSKGPSAAWEDLSWQTSSKNFRSREILKVKRMYPAEHRNDSWTSLTTCFVYDCAANGSDV